MSVSYKPTIDRGFADQVPLVLNDQVGRSQAHDRRRVGPGCVTGPRVVDGASTLAELRALSGGP